MNIIIKQIKIMERMDQLIRLQATGTPEDFASSLEISKTKLYRVIDIMRTLNAPIEYDIILQSFVYAEAVGFRFGFYRKKQKHKKLNSLAR
ncbi:hypothetical protein ATO12_17900 [Aquimarina atlantica]|uniref:Uncharacterized protein n=1 Tax=Aquimarina atlantica TaxID=1317122 RepID=A0A023BUU4_9FLAO|nr:hypothetical protein [Aquimarina atlantica]EZH73807.1 hypothetical protein ATO12_17900 [Aquimarina atlantica]